MSTTTTTKGTGAASVAPAGTTTVKSRMTALARAELTLLGRSRATLVTALLVPLLLPLSVRSATDQMDLEKVGLSAGTVILPAAVGFALLFAIYTALTSIYVVRREELVLKRLRTGELRDPEIWSAPRCPPSASGSRSAWSSRSAARSCSTSGPRPRPISPCWACCWGS